MNPAGNEKIGGGASFAEDLDARSAGMALGAILLAGAIFRLWILNGDLPLWAIWPPTGDVMWWAHAARTKILEGDYFATDSGRHYLLNPIYTWMMVAVYKVAGVGFLQTRAVSLASEMAWIGVASGVLWKLAGKRAALLGAGVLALSPFSWTYTQTGLPEALQSLLIAAGFALWVLRERSIAASAAAGALIGLAVGVKPTAILVGCAPIGAAAAVMMAMEWSAAAGGQRAELRARFVKRWLACIAGFGAVMGVILIAVVIPHWDLFWGILGSVHVEYAASPGEWLTLPGRALLSRVPVERTMTTRIWNLARWSPAMMGLVWLTAARCAANGITLGPSQAAARLRAGALVWAFLTYFFISAAIVRPDYRFIAILPVTGILAGLAFLPAEAQLADRTARAGLLSFVGSVLRWLVILLPILALALPFLARTGGEFTRSIKFGANKGLSDALIATGLVFGWCCVVAAIARFAGAPRVEDQTLLRLGRAFLPLLLLYEGWVAGGYAFTKGTTFVEAQKSLAPLVSSGAMMAGHNGGTLLMNTDLKIIRRIVPESGLIPPSSPDWDPIRPKYFTVMKRENYGLLDDYESTSGTLTAKGYRLIKAVGMGPKRGAIDRYEFDLMGLDAITTTATAAQ